MQNKYLYLLAIIIPLMWTSCAGKEKKSKDLAKALTEMADNLNKLTPTQLDENTLFLGAEVTSDNKFKYLYQIINIESPESLMDNVEVQTRSNIREAFQINPGLKIFTDNMVLIDYIYHNEQGEVIRTIHITPNDYK